MTRTTETSFDPKVDEPFCFAREKAPKFYDEARDLITQHYSELGDPTAQFKPDLALFFAAEESNNLLVYTVRKGNKIAGYAIFIRFIHQHYMGEQVAECTALFLDPMYRGLGVGKGFLAWCDEQLKLENVQVVYHHVKASNDFSPILTGIGYGLDDYLYSKRL